MVHHITLYKLKAEVSPETLEFMVRRSKSLLLKIPEVLSVRCGKKIAPNAPWPFFIAIDFESLAKQAICKSDPVYLKFQVEVITPHTSESLVTEFEMDPGKNVKYS